MKKSLLLLALCAPLSVQALYKMSTKEYLEELRQHQPSSYEFQVKFLEKNDEMMRPFFEMVQTKFADETLTPTDVLGGLRGLEAKIGPLDMWSRNLGRWLDSNTGSQLYQYLKKFHDNVIGMVHITQGNLHTAEAIDAIVSHYGTRIPEAARFRELMEDPAYIKARKTKRLEYN